MANTSLTLGIHWEKFIKNEIVGGRYASASEVVRCALRTLEEKAVNTHLELLRHALIQGELSGDAGELNMQTIRREAKSELSPNLSNDA
ncbi:MAG: type II toxin-antitoxin system ParD family antitoxin [Rickettsiales bacterium]|nr:MAG: type II toxin-antitoxin system ParD family antitoxin [Rickettsiales bacterium]